MLGMSAKKLKLLIHKCRKKNTTSFMEKKDWDQEE